MRSKLNLLKEIIYFSLAFILPFVMLIIVFASNKIALFDYKNSTTIMIDLQSQYIAFIRDFRRILLEGGSFVYTGGKSLGGDYLSLFTFYLASPLNLIVVFFKEEALPLFFVWTSIIKMSLASLAFYTLCRLTGKFTYQKLIFALGYGLISYSFVYMSNFMWLDGVMILPIVVLGIHFLKEKRCYWVYPVALAYSLMTSWYIGFMVCVFAVIYFIYLFFAFFEKEDGEYYKFAIRFAIFSLLGGLLSVTYWLTAYFLFDGTKAALGLPQTSTWASISIVLSGFLENNYSSSNLISQNDGYMTMFVGIVPLVFALAFLFCAKFTLKDRLLMLAMLMFYLIFGANSISYALLHGGREPTWFPTRFSFIMGFLICLMAYKGADHAHETHPLVFALIFVIGIIVYIILSKVKYSDRLDYYHVSGPSFIIFCITIAFSVLVATLYRLNNEKYHHALLEKIMTSAISLLIIAQIISVYRGASNVFKVNQYQNYATYLKDCEYQPIIDKIKDYEKEEDNLPFYRMETTFNRPGNYNSVNNNPFFYSYNGISTFTSSGKKDVENHMKKLGFLYNGFFVKYEAGSTFAMNSYLGIKYLVEDKASYENIHPEFLDKAGTFEKLVISNTPNINYYKNNKVMSLGFLTDKSNYSFVNEGVYQQEKNETYWFNHFEYQNTIFKEINRSINEDIFKRANVTNVNTTLDYTVDDNGVYVFKNVKSGNTAHITYQIPTTENHYPVYFGEHSGYGNAFYYVNSVREKVNTYWDMGIFSIKESQNGIYDLSISFNKNEEKLMLRPEFYYEDLTVLDKYINASREGEFVLDKVKNTLTTKDFVGHISLTNKADKNLLFTIPNQKGIEVVIDGKKVKTMTRFNIFTSVDVSNLEAGEHKVTIRYRDTGLSVTLPIFFISLGGSVPLIMFYNRLENKIFKKKKEELEVIGA